MLSVFSEASIGLNHDEPAVCNSCGLDPPCQHKAVPMPIGTPGSGGKDRIASGKDSTQTLINEQQSGQQVVVHSVGLTVPPLLFSHCTNPCVSACSTVKLAWLLPVMDGLRQANHYEW